MNRSRNYMSSEPDAPLYRAIGDYPDGRSRVIGPYATVGPAKRAKGALNGLENVRTQVAVPQWRDLSDE
ncbi:hypothetical protein AB4Y81_03030 [Paenarthrobacter sp. TAF1]|uniref:hypothetical protein n=1 Tax=Paenarthrobacter sp. TAF1 TaxID=3233067 RepID=UPI003F9A6E0D